MDVRVSGHQVDVGTALRGHVEQRLSGMADKYFSRAISAQVTFGRGPHDHGFTCEIIAYVPHGVVLKGTSQGQEAHPTFDQAAERIEKQLRRYNRRLKDRSPTQAFVQAQAVSELDGAAYTIFAEPIAEEETAAENHPPIIAETRVDIPESSVSDAVMLMDLRNTNALMFRNSGTGAFNMVYRRGDGTIGWVEPRQA